ncbi:OB-fold domain-containing protein [Streptomyces sp. ZYX-F-203]
MTLLAPVVDADGAPFWRYAARGELRVQSCADCGRPRFPPRPCCPHCRSFAREWRAMSGRGRIWSYVVAHPPLPPAYAALAPYHVVVVELADDPRIRLVGDLAGPSGGDLAPPSPGDVAIGTRVRAIFTEEGMPRWTPEES